MINPDDHQITSRVVVQSSSDLPIVLEEPHDYLDCYTISVEVAHDETGETVEIGEISATIIRIGTAINEGSPLSFVFDADSELVNTYYEALVDDSDSIRHELIELPGDVLVIRSFTLDPKWPGRSIGLDAMAGTIHLLGRDCCLVAIEPAPLNREELSEAEQTKARKRLARHWEQLSFRRVRRTTVWSAIPDVVPQSG